MAGVSVEVGGRRYDVACRDGEEGHLQSLARLVDERARDAAAALGPQTENRLLLLAALLIADDLKEARSGHAAAPAPVEDGLAERLESLADRVEKIARTLEPAGRPS